MRLLTVRIPSVVRPSCEQHQPTSARATSYSYESEQDALALDRDASRMKLLTGMWKFHFAAEETDAPADFFKVGFDCSAWNDIPVPSCWEIQDFGVRTILDAEYKDARLKASGPARIG